MKDAMVAIEDARFYEHGGLDVQGTLPALVRNLAAGGAMAPILQARGSGTFPPADPTVANGNTSPVPGRVVTILVSNGSGYVEPAPVAEVPLLPVEPPPAAPPPGPSPAVPPPLPGG